MKVETMAAKDQTGRQIRRQQVFEMTKAALTGLMAAKKPESAAELQEAARTAVVAAKLTVRELMHEQII